MSYKIRIENLKDVGHAHAVLNPNIPNALAFIQEKIIDNKNIEEAESFLVALENKDKELQDEIKSFTYQDLRKAAYPSIEQIVVAIIEEDVDQIEAIKSLRLLIKEKYPKI